MCLSTSKPKGSILSLTITEPSSVRDEAANSFQKKINTKPTKYKNKTNKAPPSSAKSNTITKQNEKKKRVHPARSKKQNPKGKKEQEQLDFAPISSDSSTSSVVSTTSTSPKPKKMKRSRPLSKNEKSQTKNNQHFSSSALHLCLTEEESNFLSMDCEMVGIGEMGKESALARVSIVNFCGHVVLDTYVKVEHEVTDYRTKISGITKKHISSKKAMDINSCRELVKSLLHGKILVGHGLKNDLKVLGISHPWFDIRDTTKYAPYMKEGQDGTVVPRKLKDLVSVKLGKEIQKEGCSHCSIVDSRAAMELYKLSSMKWEKTMEYKINKTKEFEQAPAA